MASSNKNEYKIIFFPGGGYPYSWAGIFEHNELKSLDKTKFDISVYASSHKNNDLFYYDLPLGVSFFNPIDKRYDNISILTKIYYLFKGFWNKEIFLEILSILFSFNHIFYKIKALFSYIAFSEFYISKFLCKFHPENIHHNNLVIYSFWMNNLAYISIKLKLFFINKFKFNVKFVSRCHGYDLYNEANMYGYIPLRKFIFENADIVSPISNYGAKYISDKYSKLYDSKVFVNKLGTFDFGVNNNFNQKNKNEFVIVSCSNLIKLKRVDMIANALMLISDINIKWVCFGDGPEKCNILNLTKNLKKNINICFCGNVSNNEIIDFYKNNYVDLFITTSSSEGIPISICEAISFGIPVVATNVGGIHELVIDDYNGKLIDSNVSVDELANVIINFLNCNQNIHDKMRKNSRELWQKEYNIITNTDKFYSFISR